MTNIISCKLIIKRELKSGETNRGLRLAAVNQNLVPHRNHQAGTVDRLEGYRELMAEIKLSEECPVGPALPGYVMALEYMRLAPFQEGNKIIAIHRLESDWCAPFPNFREMAATYPHLELDMVYFGADEGFCGAIVARNGKTVGRYDCDITPMEELTPLLSQKEKCEMPSYLVEWQWFTLIQAYRAAGLRDGEVVSIPCLEDCYENTPIKDRAAPSISDSDNTSFLAFVAQFSNR